MTFLIQNRACVPIQLTNNIQVYHANMMCIMLYLRLLLNHNAADFRLKR